MFVCSRWPMPRCSSLIALVLAATCARAADTPAKRADHPIVPGFERFHAGGTDAVKGGRLLLGELNCTSCHQPESGPDSQRKQAPILDGVGNRVRRSYLRKFLNDPHAIKPGTTMPNLFAALPEAERGPKIEALVHFLASTGTLKQGRPDDEANRAGQAALSAGRLRRLPRHARQCRQRPEAAVHVRPAGRSARQVFDRQFERLPGEPPCGPAIGPNARHPQRSGITASRQLSVAGGRVRTGCDEHELRLLRRNVGRAAGLCQTQADSHGQQRSASS